MPKQAMPVDCNPKDRAELEKWARGSKIEKRLAERAKIILLCLDGKTNTEIALELKTRRLREPLCSKRLARPL